MIVLLSCFINLSSKAERISSMGGVTEDSITTDSILISYSDLRKVNAKLIELDYERRINEQLRIITHNDSIAINNLRNSISRINYDANKAIQSVKKQRDVLGCTSVIGVILLIISLL